jgi:hypothetical protein
MCFGVPGMHTVHAQEGRGYSGRQEFQQWVNLSLRYSPRRSPLVVNAEYVVRNYGFFDEFKGSYYYLQTRYRFSKHLHADLHLRYVNTRFEDRYRYEFGLRYRHKLWGGLVQFRTAFFNERRQFGLADDIRRLPDHYLRNRLMYRYGVTKTVRVYASAELFHRLNRQPEPELRRVAYIGGVGHELSKRSTVFVEYIHQPEFGRGANRLHTVNIGLDHDISPKKKKKKKKKGDGRKAPDGILEDGPQDRR